MKIPEVTIRDRQCATFLGPPAPGVSCKTTVVCPEPLQAYDRAPAQTVPANRRPVPSTR